MTKKAKAKDDFEPRSVNDDDIWKLRDALAQVKVGQRLVEHNAYCTVANDAIERLQSILSFRQQKDEAGLITVADVAEVYSQRYCFPCPGDRACEAATKLREELDSLRVDFAVVMARAEKAEANYRFMVEKAASRSLDGYRELGMQVAAALDDRDTAIARSERAEAEVARLTRGLWHMVIDCDRTEDLRERNCDVSQRIVSNLLAGREWDGGEGT